MLKAARPLRLAGRCSKGEVKVNQFLSGKQSQTSKKHFYSNWILDNAIDSSIFSCMVVINVLMSFETI